MSSRAAAMVDFRGRGRAGGALAAFDWFLPPGRDPAGAELPILRSFALLHLVGPLLGLTICAILAGFDRSGDKVLSVLTGCVLLFWTAPLALRLGAELDRLALASVQALTFVCLFGAYHYGGFNSPFAPWFVVAVLVGFLYAPRLIGLCLVGMAAQVLLFAAALRLGGPPADRITPESLSLVSAASVVTATLYVTILSVFYTAVRKKNSDLAAAAREHEATARQLRSALEEARSANQRKSAFLARVSHELRTPLNVVIGYSEMLAEDAAVQEQEARVRDLKRITEASRHLLSLVNKVIDVAEVESSSLKIESETFDLDDFFDRLADSVAPLVEKNGNRLEIGKSGPLGAMTGDPLKVRQCLLNLLSNAGKFTQNGLVTLRAAVRRTSLGGSVVFEVVDSGPGIAVDRLQRLFAPGSPAPAPGLGRAGGSGLGLALTRRFCTLMGGSLEVESRPGLGSTFRLVLPLLLPDSAAEAARPAADAGAAPIIP